MRGRVQGHGLQGDIRPRHGEMQHRSIHHGIHEIRCEVLPPNEAVSGRGESAPEGMQGDGDKLVGRLQGSQLTIPGRGRVHSLPHGLPQLPWAGRVQHQGGQKAL